MRELLIPSTRFKIVYAKHIMLLDDEHITIAEIYQLQDKGLNMTLREKNTLDMYYKYLPETQGVYDQTAKSIKRYSYEQQQFVNHVLLECVKYKLPKLNEILALYGMSMDTVFVWQDTII